MATFYDNWLDMWNKAEQERKDARVVIHEEEIEWLETQQDQKIGLLGAPETGFRTWGTTTMVAEIEPGHKTGKHKHGEETIHVVEGNGCTIVNGRRYNWGKNSTLVIPFGAEHQHFNTGDTNLAVLLRHGAAPRILRRSRSLHATRKLGQGCHDTISARLSRWF